LFDKVGIRQLAVGLLVWQLPKAANCGVHEFYGQENAVPAVLAD
jgi:hypothetical protein